MAKRKKKGDVGTVVKGTVSNFDQPDWGPLENVLPLIACDQFMWMCEIQLETKVPIHCYKHRWNRRSLHLSARGEAFTYLWRSDELGTFDPDEPGEYERVQLHRLLAAVLGNPRWHEIEDAEARVYADDRNLPYEGAEWTG